MISFQLYTDAALTAAPAEDDQYVQLDSGGAVASGSPRTVQLWLGSTATGTQLRAASDPGVDQITVTIAQTVPAWSAAAAVSAGALIRPTTTNNRVYQAGGSGTTGATEPTWPTTLGATVVDNDLTWTCLAYEDTPNEVKLAATEAGLASATPGAALNLGTTILSGVGNAATFWMQRTDADLVIQDQTHLRLSTNATVEDAV